MIANATKNSDGTLTDHGKLNYTGKLELKDIEDHNYNSSSSFNVSTSIGIPQKGTKEAANHPKGSTTIGLNTSGQETEQLTKATMGQGTVNTTADTNRYINNTQEITRDQTTGMLDGSVTIDHRLLAESGREQIIQEQKDLPENAKKSAENIRNGIDELALKLPDSQIQNKILTSINQLVGDDLIANAYKEFINNGGTKEEFFVVAKSKVAEDSIINLAQANRQIEDLVSKGYSIEEILNTSVKKAGDTSVISIEGEYQTKLTADTTIGMQLLTASYDLAKQYGDFQKHIYEEYGVDIDPNTLSVIIGTILTGPAKTLANVLTSEAYQKYGAQYVEARKDQLANYVTASAYGTSPEKISVYSDPNLKEQISKESQETIDWSKDVSESKEGAKFLTNIIESMVVGGVGKGIAKTTKIDGQDVEVSKSNFEIDISQNNKHTEIIDFEKSKQKGTPENQMVNNLKANRHYELSNGTKFKTNEYGHVEEISFKPDFDNKGVRDSRQTAVGKLGEERDVGGHIQGCAMGGTCDRYNLFPQDANFNNSAYKVYFENILKKADKEGKTIDNVTVKFTRDDLSSVRPDKLEVTFLINGKPTRETFVNTAGGGK